jgi:hypothetical protein
MPQHMTNQDALALGEEQEKIVLPKAKRDYAIVGIIIFVNLVVDSYYYAKFWPPFVWWIHLFLNFLMIFVLGMTPLQWKNSEQLRAATVRWYLYNTPKERSIRLIPLISLILVYFGLKLWRMLF